MLGDEESTLGDDTSENTTTKNHQRVLILLSIGERFVLELAFDDTFVKTYHLELYLKAYSRVLHAQDFPKRVDNDVYCNC